MKTRNRWLTGMVLFASFGFLVQTSTGARAQDNQPDGQDVQNQDVQNDAQNNDYQNNDYRNDDGQNDADDQDPPGRVARLNFSQGEVSFQPGGENDWVTAVPNRPMAAGDNLWADENSRAEAHIGSTAIRLGDKTGITFLAIDDRTVQLRLAQGSLILRVRHVDDDDTYEVDTPNLAFTVLQPGEYRFDVNDDGSQTVITVWQGRGRVTGGGFSHTVLARQSATFTGNDHLDYDLGQIPRQDDFDRWAFDRDSREDRADSANYVSREMTGYEDLDEYGDWSYVAGYGPCWRPRAVVVGWAPYRFGHWVWVGPWGWTWVEDEPWGFAPFHYGRWAFVSNGWFWVPGPVVVRPIWAPALVAFVGGGPGFHFSVGVGVGWFPLAPGEVFVPGYRVSRGYVNRVNITNTTVNITKVTNVYNTVVIHKSVNNIRYINQRVNNGVTVVSHETFVNARPVARNVMRVDPREVERAPIARVVPVEPVRQSVLGAGRPGPVKPPARVINRQVVAQRTPPVAPRSFEIRQQQAGGRLNQEPQERPERQPARPVQPGVNTQRPQPGFRPFGPPNGGNNQGQADQERGRTQAPTQPPVQQRDNRDTQPQPQNQMRENRNAEPRGEDRNPQPENRNAQPDNRNQPTLRPPQREEVKPAPQERQPLVKPAPPVQERNQQQEREEEQKFRNWQQQRPTPPPSRQENVRPQEPKHEKPPAQEKQDRTDKPSKPKGH